ncbi:kinase-like domain-containing protein [Mucor lusitanicus]|uniref:Kinase-like domain-containing protein n=1 Tax=Mucor circinelloides f. lusitanicus TaxID=29924 RepID=A0A8H4BG16_MUCCL|nr:kinase-like domain-containing protein [Mucor lusitanicus]
MNSFEQRGKKLYTASLAAGNISFRDTPNSTSQRMRDSQFTLGSDDDEDSDWDSEPELEVARVQEAARLSRRVPSIRNNSKSTTAHQQHAATTHQSKSNSSGSSSPFYCMEIGPQLDLGYQWPQQPLHETRGFVKVSPSNTSSRQRQVDRMLLARRQKSMTVNLKDTYSAKNPKFAYDQDKIPKRILTKPSKPFRNEMNDNENYDYILKVNEILGHDPNYQYRVIDLLGQGTFGQVVKCERISTGELFSVKLDPDDKHHILRLHHIFSHKHHLCLVFELLSYNLYDLIGHNRYKGFAPEKVRAFAVQILDTLCLLKEAKIIHCDLKPENILLESEKSLTIKVIDFGSSCHEANRIYTYIQSRFYRSPEVLLNMRYTGAIDMWSFGCIVAELFLGLPLFPGSSEYNQLFRIVEMLGIPSKDMLSKGRNTNNFFNKKQIGPDNYEYELKSREQYSQENNKNELPRKKYFPQTKLKDIIMMFNNGKPSLSREEERRRAAAGSSYYLKEDEERQKEIEARLCILDFLYGVLELNPLKRWTPQQALQHPFITQKPYTGPFKPDDQIKRAESMGKPTAPEQIQIIAKKIQSPINKYPKEQQQQQHESYSKQPPSDAYRQRNTRSQGDYIGLLPPEVPSSSSTTTNAAVKERKVKISQQIKVRTGSHESMRAPPTDGQTVRGGLDGGNRAGSKYNARKAHAGEAAGGLLMMRRDDSDDRVPQASTSTTKRTMAGAFKRRAGNNNVVKP